MGQKSDLHDHSLLNRQWFHLNHRLFFEEAEGYGEDNKDYDRLEGQTDDEEMALTELIWKEDECDESFQENGPAEPETNRQDKDEPMTQGIVIEKGETASGSRVSSAVVSDMVFMFDCLLICLQLSCFCACLFG